MYNNSNNNNNNNNNKNDNNNNSNNNMVITTYVGDYMIAASRNEFQPVQPRQISPYDYMWKLTFVAARQDSFPPSICLDLHAFSLNFSLLECHFAKLKTQMSIDLKF